MHIRFSGGFPSTGNIPREVVVASGYFGEEREAPPGELKRRPSAVAGNGYHYSSEVIPTHITLCEGARIPMKG